ncbi:hypothetical protein PF010_g30898 [Phytophthora fragariae]|uniref:Uncharacterized protein n=2 Tax=Phytophthora TaxID=4783 RepID=A0A6A3DD04_9STRA|nr:hypothetical protein PF009_g30192 [Phytophthora fragariae]KAE8962834.1 hypothetical protein PR002_g29485 [Phytophthora rubi]KAE8962958.1 hypothetical protein PR001_g29534 [Phytophthora rubi]KAE9058706.1 hypothetical protein PF010_g30898 [Phytophthora fragariae]KAE9270904.1 hypothetical protein PR003_g30676 [Phytophthora rubi]
MHNGVYGRPATTGRYAGVAPSTGAYATAPANVGGGGNASPGVKAGVGVSGGVNGVSADATITPTPAPTGTTAGGISQDIDPTQATQTAECSGQC